MACQSFSSFQQVLFSSDTAAEKILWLPPTTVNWALQMESESKGFDTTAQALQNASWVGQGLGLDPKLSWLATERVDKFLSNLYWTETNMSDKHKYIDEAPVTSLECYSVPDNKRIPFKRAVKGNFLPCKISQSFGPSWSTHWFRVELDVPRDWEKYTDDYEVHFLFHMDCEALLFTDGQPQQGFAGDVGRVAFCLGTPKTLAGQRLMVYVEAACNQMFGVGNVLFSTGLTACDFAFQNGQINPPDPTRRFTLKFCHLGVFNKAFYSLQIDFKLCYELSKEVQAKDTSGVGVRALRACNAAIDVLGPCARDENKMMEAKRILRSFLQLPLDTRKAPELKEENQEVICAIGHCHLDTAWLWPYAETVRKAARSWCSQLKLMERFSQYRFTVSQAQQLDWVRLQYPSLWTQLEDAWTRGQFCPVGGTWVEMDCNLPSGEALVRQFVFGQRFFQEHFQEKCTVFWLPDTFGYSSQLPQLCQQSGIRFFMTNKLSWNLINEFPHHSFVWQGLDGSRLLVHFPPAGSYNSDASITDTLASLTRNKQRSVAPVSMLVFGHGDGGGGPTEDMLQRLERMSLWGTARAPNERRFPFPRVTFSSPNEFFHTLEASADLLPVWVGELYFELHRGTYTSQGAIKRGNRRCQELLRTAEALTSLMLLCGLEKSDICSEACNTEELSCWHCLKMSQDTLWKDVLLNQFHDVLPGTCIAEVVRDAMSIYTSTEAKLEKHIAAIMASLAVYFSPEEASVEEEVEVEETFSIPAWCKKGCDVKAQWDDGYWYDAVVTGELQANEETNTPAQVMVHYVDDDVDQTLSICRVKPRGGLAEFFHVRSPEKLLSQTRKRTRSVSMESASKKRRTHGTGPDLSEKPSVLAQPVGHVNLHFDPRSWTEEKCSALLVVNTLEMPRREVVDLPVGLRGAVENSRTARVPHTCFKRSVTIVESTPLGVSLYPWRELTNKGRETEEKGVNVEALEHSFVIENRRVRATIGHCGRLLSFIDKRTELETVGERHVLEAPAGFVQYSDVPLYWDAWDVMLYHQLEPVGAVKPKSFCTLSWEGTGEGRPLRAGLEMQLELSDVSSMLCRVTLDANSSRLDFSCRVVWNDAHRVLKMEFPLAVAAKEATYETQFGWEARPTHCNTKRDLAKFEVCAQRWADLSEHGYGVALLNDCKHGHSCLNGTLALTLLRGSRAPDPGADKGVHFFRFALFPHAESWQSADVVREAQAFQQPPLFLPFVAEKSFRRPSFMSFLKLSTPALVLSAVKLPEVVLEERPLHGVVVRVHEVMGSRGSAVLSVRVLSHLTLAAEMVNILEDTAVGRVSVPSACCADDSGQLSTSYGKVAVNRKWKKWHISFDFKPFEILTIQLIISKQQAKRPGTAKRSRAKLSL